MNSLLYYIQRSIREYRPFFLTTKYIRVYLWISFYCRYRFQFIYISIFSNVTIFKLLLIFHPFSFSYMWHLVTSYGYNIDSYIYEVHRCSLYTRISMLIWHDYGTTKLIKLNINIQVLSSQRDNFHYDSHSPQVRSICQYLF